MAKKNLPVLYDCSKCPGYCCSYEHIIVTRRDVARLAKRFELDYEQAERRFTKSIKGYGRVLRHRKDTVYKSTCQFFHPTERRCTVYEHRPTVCRQYPDERRCRYFDFLMWERDHQDDESFVPLAR
ncbi:MAG: YkgJ family cysteine cluster protein [Acidobacteria bacterium]|nr:YkgJ family cysteine cluster protein [Acidobacteriota bacterium]MCW5969241.1 YkgJ family cysteine cluster protein [Blastocatellales bacterium]